MHIGFIMDGNRRWAEKRWMLKYLWHDKGADTMENVVDMCLKEWVEHVSIWALAKKNITERSNIELDHLYDLLLKRIPMMTPKFIKNGVKFETVGNLDLLPKKVKEALLELQDKTKKVNKITFILAIWYWWQDEIVRGIKNYIESNINVIESWELTDLINNFDENEFAKYIDTGKYPPPDLIVRTWWDIRTSWYFLYQSEYSEMYFTPTLWPDFDEIEFQKAITKLKDAKRNFGK